MKPKRIQLSRRQGWRMPPNTVSVARPSKWGNPFRGPNAAANVRDFRNWVLSLLASGTGYPLRELRGKNLACWCTLCDEHHKDGLPLGVKCDDCAPCHADVLLELANAEGSR